MEVFNTIINDNFWEDNSLDKLMSAADNGSEANNQTDHRQQVGNKNLNGSLNQQYLPKGMPMDEPDQGDTGLLDFVASGDGRPHPSDVACLEDLVELEPRPISVLHGDTNFVSNYPFKPTHFKNNSTDYLKLFADGTSMTSQPLSPENGPDPIQPHVIDSGSSEPESRSSNDESRRTPLTPVEEDTASHASNSTGMTVYAYQEEQWMARYQDLVEFYFANNHSNVPYSYRDHPGLALWVKRQRHQYKRWKKGEHSHLTHTRVHLLNKLNFVWDAQSASWLSHYSKFKAFCEREGHTNVHADYDISLSHWVKRHKRMYQAYVAKGGNNGKKSKSLAEFTSPGINHQQRMELLSEVLMGQT